MTVRKGPPRANAGRVTLSRGSLVYSDGGNNEACKASLRKDFEGRCAYCLWHEERNRSEFEIDHFRAQSQHGTHKYKNLRFSCGACNRYKGSLPTKKQLLRGERIIDPCAEWDYGDHLAERQDRTLEALTHEGRFHLDRLRLNCGKLIEERKVRDEKAARCGKLADILKEDHYDEALRIKLLALLSEEKRDLAVMLPTQDVLLARRQACNASGQR